MQKLILLYVRNIFAQFRNHDWRNNLPIWMVLAGLCFSMILFAVAVKHVWDELRHYESMCKQADLSMVARQRHVRLAFIESRKNPVPRNTVKHRCQMQRAAVINQSGSANSDDMKSNVIKIPPAPGSRDTDKDGLYDVEEQVLGTDWRRSDTDGDGINDAMELKMGLDPTSWNTVSDNTGRGNPAGGGDGSVQFGTFSYPSSGSRQEWDSPPQKEKNGKKRLKK